MVELTHTPSATLTDTEAARYIGLSVSHLRASRLAKPRTDGPPYIRVGRAVRYLPADLDAWLAARRVTPGPGLGDRG